MSTQKSFNSKYGFDNNNKTLINVADPVNAQDAATKNFSSNASNLSSGTLVSSILPSSGVLAGTYNSVTVDDKGRVTVGANNSYLTANQSISVTGDATGSGNTSIALTLATVATAGTYKSVTVDAKGRVTAGTNPTTLSGYGITDALNISNSQIANYVLAAPNGSAGSPVFRAIVPSDIPVLNQNTTGSASSLSTARTISSTGDATWSVSFDGSSNASSALTLSNVVTAQQFNNSGTSQVPVTIDAKGRVIALGSSITITPAWSSITTKPTTLSGYGITDAVSNTTSQTANYVLAAPNGVSGAPVFRAIVPSDIPVLNQNTTGSASSLSTARTISSTGDATWSVSFDGSSNVSSAITLVNSGVTSGTYKSVTVDAKGRVTAGTNPTTLSGYGITDALNISNSQIANYVLAAPNGSAGSPVFRAIVPSDIPVLNQNTTGSASSLSTARTISSTGDATWSVSFDGSSNASSALTLTSTGVTSGTYNSVTVDVKGRVTAGTNPTTLAGYGITDATPISHVGSSGTAHAVVTTSVNGFMSASDKVKIDGITANANNYIHPISGVTAGTYKSVTVDIDGHVTSGTNPTTLSGYGIADAVSNTTSQTANYVLAAPNGVSGAPVFRAIVPSDIPVLNQNTTGSASSLSTARTISSTGDATWSVSFDGSSNTTGTLTLATVATAGTYKSVTVDAKGRVTAGTNPTTLAGYGITDAVNNTTSQTANYVLAAPNGSAGSPVFRAIVPSDIPVLNQNTTGSASSLSTARTISSVGDGTWSVSFNGSADVSGSLTLATVATAGTYKSVTVDVKGRVTAGTNPTTLAGYGITDALTASSNIYRSYGVVNTGKAANTNGTYINQYYKVLSVTLSAQYYDYTAELTAMSISNGLGVNYVSKLNVRIKQQAAFGSDPFIECIQKIDTTSDPCLYFYNIVQNTPTTIVDIYLQNNVSWNQVVYFIQNDYSNGGVPTYYGSTDSYITTLPTPNVAFTRWKMYTDSYHPSADILATARTVTHTGDLTGAFTFNGSSDVNSALTLVASGVTAGTYKSVTVDAKGRVTAGTNPTTLAGYGITDAAPLASPVFSGTVTNNGPTFILNPNGSNAAFEIGCQNGTATTPFIDFHSGATVVDYDTRILSTSGTGVVGGGRMNYYAGSGHYFTGNLYGVFVGNSSTSTALGTARTIAITGDGTWSTTFDGSANVTSALTLASSGVSAGTYNSVTVDVKGRVTAGTNPTTLAGYGITDAAPLVHSHTIIGYNDTRGTNFSPVSYSGLSLHLKTNSTDSLSDGGSYHSVLNVASWNDYTAGYAHQLAFTDNNNLYHRSTNTGSTFSTWDKIWTASTLTDVSQLANSSGYLTSNQSITISGDASGTGSNSISLTLSNTGVTEGTYNSVTVDAKGRVISATNTGTSITGAATTIASTNLTANLALISDSSGKVAVSTTTSTELGYLSGVTSSIQTQLSAKEPFIPTGSTSQFLCGDKTFTTITPSNLGLGNVENTALSTWSGSSNITTVGAVTATSLSTTGAINMNQGSILSATLTTAATTANQVLTTLSSSTYRTVKILVQCVSGTSYHSSEIIAIHDGTTVYINEYGTVYSASTLATYDMDISGGNLRLLVTPFNAVTTFKALIISCTV